MQSKRPAHLYEVRPRKDKRGVDLISDQLAFGRLWYGDAPLLSVTRSSIRARSGRVIRVFDETGAMIERHEQARRLQRVVIKLRKSK